MTSRPSRWQERPRQRLVEIGYATGWRVVRAAPEGLVLRVSRAMADRAVRRRGRGVSRLAANLRTVVGEEMPAPEFDRLLTEAVRSYARYWCELFRSQDRTASDHLAGFRLDGAERLEEALSMGRGVVLALPHMGNWDAAGAWVAARGWSIVAVAERLRPEGLFDRFVAARGRMGMEIVPLTGGDRPVSDVLAERLSRGYAVALVSDRDFSGKGVEVDFFGRTTTMPPGPALLAIRTGAPLMTVSIWFEDDCVCARVDPPLEIPEGATVRERVRQLTQQMADNFQAGIAAHPADWHMMQRVWPD